MGDVKNETVSAERLERIAKECADAEGVSIGGWRFKSDYVSFSDMGSIITELIALRQPDTRMEGGGEDADDLAVDRFAAAMKAKLKWEREERGRSGWQNMTEADLSRLLMEHLPKGDPVDVANFCMMLSENGQLIQTAPSSPTVGELEAKLSQTRGAAVNELAVEIDANRTLRAQLAEARKVLSKAMDFRDSDYVPNTLFDRIAAFLASLREKQDAE